MHLGAAAEFFMFRRTLAAILRTVLDLGAEDDPRLFTWINIHLGVNAVPAPDPDRLAETETAVLDLLDPPLNLRGRPPSAIRARLAELRHDPGADLAARAAPVLPVPGPPGPSEPLPSHTERGLRQAKAEIYETAKPELGYYATWFFQMISLAAAKAAAVESDTPRSSLRAKLARADAGKQPGWLSPLGVSTLFPMSGRCHQLVLQEPTSQLSECYWFPPPGPRWR